MHTFHSFLVNLASLAKQIHQDLNNQISTDPLNKNNNILKTAITTLPAVKKYRKEMCQMSKD